MQAEVRSSVFQSFCAANGDLTHQCYERDAQGQQSNDERRQGRRGASHRRKLSRRGSRGLPEPNLELRLIHESALQTGEARGKAAPISPLVYWRRAGLKVD